MCLTLPFEFWW